jgi:hypothetical protein
MQIHEDSKKAHAFPRIDTMTNILSVRCSDEKTSNNTKNKKNPSSVEIESGKRIDGMNCISTTFQAVTTSND